MVLDASFPPDIRVEKEAITLINSNLYEVYLICLRKKNEEVLSNYNGLNIIRINSPALDQKVKKGILDAIFSINNVHYIFYRQILKLHQEINFDIIHVHDLPLSKTVRKVAKKVNIPYIIDLHENYAEALKVWFKWRTNKIIRLKNMIFFNYRKWNKYERNETNKAKHIIAVVEEMKDRLVKKHGLKEKKIKVISNTEHLDFHNDSKKISLSPNLENKFLITYIGGIGPHRGIDTAVEAMVDITAYINNAVLLIIGGGSKEVLSKLNTIVSHNNLEKNVVIFGKVDKSLVSPYMKISDINIIPHLSNSHTNHTIPHKIFQILLSKKPILVSDSAPLKRIISEYDAGFIHEASNSKSFANEVIHIYNDYESATKKAMNGFKACNNGSLNWSSTAKELLNFYSNI